VLHVLTRLKPGGCAENTVGSIVGLKRVGYEGTLAVAFRESEVPVLDDALEQGIRLLDVPALGRDVALLADLMALGQLLRILAAERPAIVHTHTAKAGFVGRLAARIARVPAVIHQPHGHMFYGYHGRARTALYVALERRAATWSDRIITLTPRGTDEHLARGIGRPEQFVTVPSGVSLERLREAAPPRAVARAILGLPPAAFVIAALGRFVPVKGFALLVDALPWIASEVPSTRLLLVGDGPDRAALEARAARLKVQGRLHIVGARADVVPSLAAADVVAAPSRNEGMGRVLVEAMALGVPVVGTAVGGIPAVIVEGECGRLVPPGDPQALARALTELGRDGALRQRLGAAAASRAEAFSSAVADAKMAAVYDQLVLEKRLA